MREPYRPDQVNSAVQLLQIFPPHRMMAEAAALFDVPVDRVKGPHRESGEVARVRQMAMTAMRRRGMSFPAIAMTIGRDHKTVWHGVRVIEGILSKEAA